jgi:protein phosphatase
MIEFGHLSHVGLKRELNEDTYYGDAALGLFLVADGMGGHDSGEVASALARDTVVREVRAGRSLQEAILRANEEIIRQSKRRNESMPMGTTIVAVKVQHGSRFELAWVGDSRAYLWNGQLRQISSDHSYVQELIDSGQISEAQARSHPYRNVVTKALGVTEPEKLTVEALSGELRPGMQLLLCSDGLTEEVDDAQIARLLAQQELSAQECVDHLIAAALDGGGTDNVTVLVLRRMD